MTGTPAADVRAPGRLGPRHAALRDDAIASLIRPSHSRGAAERTRLAQGWFLEHAEVYGRLYGTPRHEVHAVLASGRHCVLVIDVQGAATLRRDGVEAAYVFLDPPSRDELERRLRARGGDDAASVARRLAEAAHELDEAASFAHRVVNADLEAASRAVAHLLGVELAPLAL